MTRHHGGIAYSSVPGATYTDCCVDVSTDGIRHATDGTLNMSSTHRDDSPGPADAANAGDPRVLLAIERTSLAWTRTALALMGFGFVVARLGLFLRELAGAGSGAAPAGMLAQSSHSLWLGTALVVLGLGVQGFALVEHRQRVRQFHSNGTLASGRWSLAGFVGLAVIGIGLAIATYLARLF
jgi:putative membrane protein